jgi:hypothetical protein
VTKWRARAQDRRLWLGGSAVAAVLIVLFGWFLVIDPELSAGSSTREEAASARGQNVALEAKNAKLKAENDDVTSLRAGLAAAVAELPFDSGLPEFTRQLSAQATANSVVLTSVVVASSVPVGDETGATTPDATATTTSPTGLVAIPITAVAVGPCSGQVEFLKAIQVAGPRRALVNDVQLAQVTAEAPCDLTVQLTIFSAPLSPTEQAVLESLLSGN